MTDAAVRLGRWLVALLIPVALAACGGSVTVEGAAGTSQSDGRNGDYKVAAANGQDYVLNLDFDKKTYHMSRDGFSDTGAIVSAGNDFFFAPAGAVAPPAGTTARFVQTNETVIGGFPFPGGVLPFVAPRAFYKTLADGAGIYNFVTRSVDTPASGTAKADTAIFQGELGTDGKLRTCNDLTFYVIANCPAASVITGTVTIAGDVFTSTTPTGAFPFRIARIGSDKVFLRASVSSATARRFWIGMPATTTFAAGNFAGATTDGDRSATSLSSTGYSTVLTTAAGTTVSRSGAARPVGPDTLSSLLRLTTPGNGDFFAVRSSELAAVVSNLGSTVAPGYLEIGKRQ